MTEIATTPELLGTLIRGDNATTKFAADPKGYLADLGIDAGVEVKAAKNTADTMNLALPYYSDLEKTAGNALSDEDLEEASGGAGRLNWMNMVPYAHFLAGNIVHSAADFFEDVGWSSSEEADGLRKDTTRLTGVKDNTIK